MLIVIAIFLNLLGEQERVVVEVDALSCHHPVVYLAQFSQATNQITVHRWRPGADVFAALIPFEAAVAGARQMVGYGKGWSVRGDREGRRDIDKNHMSVSYIKNKTI